MTIRQIPEGPTLDDPENFDNEAEAAIQGIRNAIDDINVFSAGLDATAAGGALSIPLTFSNLTTDSDPGAGIMRLDNATQNVATTLRIDLLDTLGNNMATLLDSLATSTSTNKAQVRIVRSGDLTKWLSFNVTAAASPSGYRNFTISNVGGSAASPFVDTDPVVLFFSRTGDKGDITSNTEYAAVPVPASNIDLALGNYHTKTVAGNETFTFSNAPANGWAFTLLVKLDSGSVAFPATVRPANGLAPSMAVGKTHRIMFDCPGGGVASPVGMVIAPNFTN